jgi:hypothetical protein
MRKIRILQNEQKVKTHYSETNSKNGSKFSVKSKELCSHSLRNWFMRSSNHRAEDLSIGHVEVIKFNF